MSAGQFECPIVFRGLNGPAASVAAQHSHCFASIYGSVNGLKTISIYDSNDAKSLLKAAIWDPNPVMFLECENLYSHEFEVDDNFYSKDFVEEIGKAKIMREGKDISLITHGKQVMTCLEAADELHKQGIDAEVINLRTIRPMDRETIINSAMKTGKVVCVDEGYP